MTDMAEFEARGEDALKHLLDRYRAVFCRMDGTDLCSIDVGAFSLERQKDGRPMYGRLEAFHRTSSLILGVGDGVRAPARAIEMPWATPEQKAAYVACGLLQRMILDEVLRAKPGEITRIEKGQ